MLWQWQRQRPARQPREHARGLWRALETLRPVGVSGLVVALVIPLLGFTWLAGEKAVALMVDGQVREVRTYAGTVGELLARTDVTLGEHDRLVPGAETALRDGMLVELVHAREIQLLIGDEQRTVLVTALDVGEVLREVGADVGRRDIVRPSRLSRVRSGMVVEVRKPVALTVLVDGAEREVITDARSVADVLERLHVTLGPHDRVTPGLDEQPAPGSEVRVQRVTRATEVRLEGIDFATVERRNADLPKGQRREVQAGVRGLKEITEDVVRVDGVVEQRTPVAQKVLREATERIVEVGTKAVPASSSPQATGSAGRGNSQEGKASWYDHPGSDPMTAAHRTLPFGTIVTVTNLANGKTVQVRINDRGPFVEGRIIDLNRPAFRQIASPSTGVLRVRITW